MKKIICGLFIFCLCLFCGIVFCGCDLLKNGKEIHEHTYTENIISPTEQSEGYTKHECSCGDVFYNNYTILINYESVSDDLCVLQNELPTLDSKIIKKGACIDEVNNTSTFRVKKYQTLVDNNYQDFDIAMAANNSTKIFVVWERIGELSQEVKTFNETLNKIKLLEELSVAYNSTNSVLRVLTFIRAKRYNTSEWSLIAGSDDANFSSYISNNQGNIDLFELQDIETLKVPGIDKSIDFVHFCATLNVLVKNNNDSQTGDLAGFGGDICQLASEVKVFGAEEYENKVNELFNSQSGGFNALDVNADIAAEIISKCFSVKDGLFNALISYHTKIASYPKNLFIINEFGNMQTSAIYENLFLRLSGNILLQVWCNSNGLSFENDEVLIELCIKAFIDYVCE